MQNVFIDITKPIKPNCFLLEASREAMHLNPESRTWIKFNYSMDKYL